MGLLASGCGGRNDGATDHTTVGSRYVLAKQPRGRSLTDPGRTVTVNGTTPFSTEVRIPNECKGFDVSRVVQTGCGILGFASFVPFVNDPSNGTLKLCLSAFDKRNCSKTPSS